MSHCSEEHLLQVQQHGVTSNIWRCNILVCRYSVTNDAFRHKLMWCCTSRLTSAVAFLPANSFLSVLCASRVLVLENGKMAEFDSPSNLISQRGAFHKMAKDSGLVWSRGVSLCRASCCRELMFPVRGTQSYVPMTFFFALKPAAVFIAQGGWAYLHKENITTSSLGSVCVALTKFIPHIKITTWISKPPHFYDGIKKLDLWVCLFYPHCPLLNSSTTCFHHHYHSSKHESFIQAVILELRHSLIVPVPACTLQEETSLNVRNQECSSLTFVTGKDVGHAATKLIGQNHTSITENTDSQLLLMSLDCYFSFSTDYLLSFSYSFPSCFCWMCWRLYSCKKWF